MNELDHEKFWAGRFGDEYINRNNSDQLLVSKMGIFKKILSSVTQLNSVLELGCNIGLNLCSISKLIPQADLYGVEINEKAVRLARQNKEFNIYHQSIIGFTSPHQYDFVFTAGVLIHIPPCHLKKVYGTLYNLSSKYILIYEYYNPTPVEIQYRGNVDKLFKRDFAGELLDRYSELKLVDYGFVYRRDPKNPDDDLTWVLMEK